MNWHQFLEGPEGVENSRFGSAITALSDINMDGFNDVIVGSPLEHQNVGAVYIYNGHGRTVRTKFSQVTRAAKVKCAQGASPCPAGAEHGDHPLRLLLSELFTHSVNM